MIRIALVDIPFRKRTRSTTFLVDLLRSADVELTEVHWDPTEGLERIQQELAESDVAVLLQLEILAPLCRVLGVPTVIIPMYDAVANLPDEYWHFVSPTSVASFSLGLHLRLRGLGYDSQHHKFFPPPSSAPRDFSDGLRGFLWERRPNEALDWPTVNHFFGSYLTSLHVHVAPDPGYVSSDLPSARRSDLPYALTSSKWRRDPAEYKTALARSNVYFAPRRTEGIGLSFLEALAHGSLVVAFDEPTHNEYLADGITGILLPSDLNSWDGASAITRAADLAEEGWHVARDGHRAWTETGAAALLAQVLAVANQPVPPSEHDLATVQAILEAWTDQPRFQQLMLAATRRSRKGAAQGATTFERVRVEGGREITTFAGVDNIIGGEMIDGGVLLSHAETATFDVAASGALGEAIIVRTTTSTERTLCRLQVEQEPVAERPVGQRQSFLRPLRGAASQSARVTVTALHGEIVVLDVLCAGPHDLSRQVSSDLDLGDFEDVLTGAAREVFLTWVMTEGVDVYHVPIASTKERFGLWVMREHLAGTSLPATLLAQVAEQSWESAAPATSTTLLPLTQLYQAVAALRRKTDPDWREQYAEDDINSVAWFYLHGIAEHDLGRLLSPQEREHVHGSGAGHGAISPLQQLVDHWRVGLPRREAKREMGSLAGVHPGLAVLVTQTSR